MKKERDPTQEEFANLLNWLAADRDTAGRKYESIRAGLVKIFVSRGCVDAEDLADEVIDRVAIGLNKIIGRYEGDPATYFYGFVHYVYLEYSRKNSSVKAPPCPTPPEELEREDQCLEQCLELLSAGERQLVLRYHQHEKRAKIDDRKKIAAEFGLTLSGLRTKVHRLCLPLEQCLRKCLEQDTY
jgi:DNA-directed RNA polymerase specialized sigma24 family protein